MLRRLLILSIFAAASQAHAAEAGKAIFVAGDVKAGDHAVREGAAVQEGELLSTGADGFLYIKTVDNGLFVLRPNTQARIAAYHVDTANPANTHVKLELIKGVARSKSGDAVKLARQNFRFNTPVAAIGVRGTDFSVYTDQDTSRVAVLTGGIVVSGFVGACRPDGMGPCEGVASRELTAAQRGQLLQVQRGQAAPQLLQGGANAPDLVSPPRPDEPVAKAPGASSNIAAEPALDVQKGQTIKQIVQQPVGGNVPPPAVTPTPVVPVPVPVTPVPVVDVPAPVVPAVPELPPRQLQWGRWVALAGADATTSLTAPAGADRIVNGNYVLFVGAGKDFVAPVQGNIGFALKDSEAYVTSVYGPVSTVSTAKLSNGALNVDFGSRTFTTSLDLASDGTTSKLQAQGTVTTNGMLNADPSYSRPGYIDVQGALTSDKGGSAAYLFNGHLDPNRTVNGATSWVKQ